eukprot:1147327_1
MLLAFGRVWSVSRGRKEQGLWRRAAFVLWRVEYSCKEIDDDGEECNIGEDGTPNCPEIKSWDPAIAAMQDFPITTYQPVYFLAESLQDAKLKMRKYCENLPRPFFALYNSQTETVHIDRPVRRAVGVPS